MISEIVPGLFVGDFQEAEDHGPEFDVVLSVCQSDTIPKFPGKVDCSNVPVHLAVCVFDDYFLLPHFESGRLLLDWALNFRTGSRVLVHCVVGQSRSVAIVLYWLVWSRNMGFYEALELVRSKRTVLMEPSLDSSLRHFCSVGPPFKFLNKVEAEFVE